MSLTYAARVLSLAESGPMVRVPMLGGGQEWGPLASSVPDLEVDDQVLVTAIGESADRLHVLARLHGRRTRQSEVVDLVDRLDDIEAKDVAQDARLGGIDTLNTAQNSRLSALESRASAIETVDNAQTTRLNGIDTLNTAQNNRLSATETVANAAATQAALTALDGATVHRTGAETVGGVKTFTAEPVIPSPSLATSPVRSDDKRLLGAGPVLEVALTTEYTGLAGNTWYGMRGNMSALVDTHSIWSQPGGSANLYVATVPVGWAGRYSMTWQLAPDSTGYNPVIAVITLNAPAATTNPNVPSYSRLRMPGPGQSQVHGEEKLAEGALISLGLHVVQSGTFNLRTILPSTTVRTMFTMRYCGPT